MPSPTPKMRAKNSDFDQAVAPRPTVPFTAKKPPVPKSKRVLNINTVWMLSTIKSKCNKEDMSTFIREAGEDPTCFNEKGATGMQEYCRALQVWYRDTADEEDEEVIKAKKPKPENYVVTKEMKKKDTVTLAAQEAARLRKLKGSHPAWAVQPQNEGKNNDVLEGGAYGFDGANTDGDDHQEEEDDEEAQIQTIKFTVLQENLALLKSITESDIDRNNPVSTSEHASLHQDLAKPGDDIIHISIPAQSAFRKLLLTIRALNKQLADGLERDSKHFKEMVDSLKTDWKKLMEQITECWKGLVSNDATLHLLHECLGEDLQEAAEGDLISDEGLDGRLYWQARAIRTFVKDNFPERYRKEWLEAHFK